MSFILVLRVGSVIQHRVNPREMDFVCCSRPRVFNDGKEALFSGGDFALDPIYAYRFLN